MAKADTGELKAQVRKARAKFAAMAATYVLGVFNDNFFKQAVMLTAAAAGGRLQGYLMVIFTAPFILFAAPAGWAADRFSKRTVVISSKGLELAAMICGAWGVLSGNWLLIYAMLGLMATQSAIFSPSLNGSIPELYPAAYVTRANGILKALTTGAILVGIALGGIAIGWKGEEVLGFQRGPAAVAAAVVAVSLLGWAVSLGVPRRPAASPGAPFPKTAILVTLKTLREAWADRLLGISIAANAIIWFVASLQILLINDLGMRQFALGETRTSVLTVAELVGIAVGGIVAGRISRGRRWYRLLSPATLALAMLMGAVSLAPLVGEYWRYAYLFTLLTGMGIAGGLFIVPVESFIQVRAAADRKGAVLSASNFAAFSGMLLSGLFRNLLSDHMAPTTGFAVAALFVLAVSGWLAVVWNTSKSRRWPMAQTAIDRFNAVADRAVAVAVRLLLRLRYRVRVRGVEEVAARGRTGILFLPNHPGFIDPFIVLSALNRRFAPRSLADKDQVDRFFIRWIARRFGTRTIPDASRYAGARDAIGAALGESIEGLRRGENLLFYPAGRIQRSYLEELGGNSAVETILRELPDVRVVLVRTRGVWGSVFSRAWGHHPVVSECLRKAVRGLVLSGVFFAPRRKVSIELVEPDDLPRAADRFALNRYLEAFYNDGAVHNAYVPYTPWEGGGTREAPEPAAPEKSGRIEAVSAAVREKVTARLREMTGRGDVRDADTLGRDLGLDSLSRVDLLAWLEEEFAVTGVEADSLSTIADVMIAASGQSISTGPERLKPVPAEWFTARPRAALEAATLTEAFLAEARRAPRKHIAADQISGARTYRDMITRILALKGAIERMPGEYVGIMLPASVAADVTYMAALFAGKTPVMVNWTVGVRNMAHALELLDVRQVLTVKALAARVEFQLGDLGSVKERLVFLEDVAAGLSIVEKAVAWGRARVSWATLRRGCVRETAAVLFTSGSESLPKAVPLTHANILANLRDLLRTTRIADDERIVGIFPPFHSFGLTCTMMLPLCGGIRVVHHANPTESAAIARIIEAYGATMLMGTPTFLRGILRASREGQLGSLRRVVSGAEKCPDSLYDELAERCPGLLVREGYGTSECSPVVAVNDEDAPVRGTIGLVMPSLEYIIVGVETGARVATGETGELFTRGESVFGGYLKFAAAQPFVEFEGRRWYRTGDLVSEDPAGVLTFRGRLKRFIKTGGEMISLPAIETVLDAHYPAGEDGAPVVAVERTADEEHPEIVLFATREIGRAEVNALLREAGLSGLYNIRRVVRMEALPLLGTGKTDYRALAAMLAAESAAARSA